MNRRYWLLVTALSLLAALVTLAVVRRPRTVPLSQCSDVYLRYHDAPGIQADFVKDFRINDTITVDVTVLQAADSNGFASILTYLGRSEEHIRFILQNHDPEARFVGVVAKNELPSIDDKNCPEEDIIACFPARKYVAVFHVVTQETYEYILLGNLTKTIKIETK
ncbi:MAG: hypothetical protein J6X79_07055 [Bacteroidales bacterium]|nr:hypothetical protein [Bacteroidales bacterium]